jgi:hypothetical protein
MARMEGIRAMAGNDFKGRQPFLWIRPEDEELPEGDDEREEDEREEEEREDEDAE